MQLVITLRKEVDTPSDGKVLADIVKKRLEDHPEVKITAHVTNHFELEEPEPPPQ